MGYRLRRACVVAVTMLAGMASTQSTLAQSASEEGGVTLRQRLDDRRLDSRRTAGERELERSNTELEVRRRMLLRQRNSPIGSQRSVPVLPKTNRSSVVVTQ